MIFFVQKVLSERKKEKGKVEEKGGGKRKKMPEERYKLFMIILK